MYKLSAIVEEEENLFVSHCVELQVASQGKSIEEALANLKEAVQLYIKHAEPEELSRLNSKTSVVATITVGS